MAMVSDRWRLTPKSAFFRNFPPATTIAAELLGRRQKAVPVLVSHQSSVPRFAFVKVVRAVEVKPSIIESRIESFE